MFSTTQSTVSGSWLIALLFALALGASSMISSQAFANEGTDDAQVVEQSEEGGEEEEGEDDSPGKSSKDNKEKNKKDGNETAEGGKPYCQKSAQYLFLACKHRTQAERWERLAECENLLGKEERKTCFADNRASWASDKHSCKAERGSRKGICEEIGREVYLGWDDVDFVGAEDGGAAIVGNDYFPLHESSVASYLTAETTIDRTVSATIREIDGVACRVVIEEHRDNTDPETETGVLLERVERLYAQDVDGNIWTCGVLRQQYGVLIEGDEPVVVSTAGSWEAGTDGAKAGIAMRWQPAFGDTDRRGYAPGIDEELAEVIDPLSLTSAVECVGGCVVLRITSPLAPEGHRDEYYESGTGLIHSENQDGEDTLDLQP